jgi:hypothetical protein
MGLIPKFTNADIQRQIERSYNVIERAIVGLFDMVGEEFVTEARNMTKEEGGFGDVTTSLRSSIGYFILKDGVIIKQDLTGNSAGIIAAKALLATLPKKDGYMLVGVAGMDYASAVESKGMNVITLQKDVALVSLDRKIDKLMNKLSQKDMVLRFGMEDLVKTVLP